MLTNGPKPFWQKDEIFLLKFRSRSKRVFLFEESFFSSKFFYAHLKCSFENAADILSTKSRNCFSNYPKNKRNTIFSNKLFFFIFFTWTRRIQSWQRSQNLSIIDQKHFTHCPKTIKNTISLRKKYFLSRCSSEHLERSVGQHIAKSLTKRRTIFANFLERNWKPK